MGVLFRSAPRGAECAFTHRDEDGELIKVPAVVTAVPEFTNNPTRYFCQDHADTINRVFRAWGYWQ